MKYEPKYASEPGHPDYDQFMTMKGMVDKMHGENGIDMNSGDISHRASAAMLRAYKTEAVRDNASLDPKERIDGVVLSHSNDRFEVGGRYAIMYQGDPNNPTVRTLAVPTQELTQPAERNFEEVNRLNAQQAGQSQERQQAQQQVQVQQQQGQDQDQLNMGTRSRF